ncbi:MAG: hypothetical protein H7263_05985 [Candidatus Sericytochromatia bacterium]|nr:hypothetical protein [Candidatus Sericytochromatia bacterium]
MKNQDIKNEEIMIDDKDFNYAKSIVEEMIKSTTIKRGRRSGSIREFDKVTVSMSNQQLIGLSNFLGKLIEKTEGNDDLLGSLLDGILEKITGTK